MTHMQYQGLILHEIHESEQFVMTSVLRVKTKAVFISKPFPTFVITLCMLDKFSYFCHLFHVQFNIKKILGASPVRPFGHVLSGFKLLQARNIFERKNN